jgi:hypothetical protein
MPRDALCAGQKNGIQRAWLEGRMVYDNAALEYQTDGSLIEKLALHNYHGGNSQNTDFKPKQDQTIWCAQLMRHCKARSWLLSSERLFLTIKLHFCSLGFDKHVILSGSILALTLVESK